MIKLLHSFALAAMLAPTPTVQNFIVDPDPTRHAGITGFFKGIKSFFKGERGSSLEKVVDYFTSTTNPSIVNANANGAEGVFLYVNDGSLMGTWTGYLIGCRKCYEHAASVKYPGDKYPGIIASFDNRLVWSAVSLGNRQNFILYQNERNSWSYVAGPGQIGDSVALIS